MSISTTKQTTETTAPGAGDSTSVTVDDPTTGTPVVVVEEQPKPKVISVPTAAMKRIKDDAAAHGRSEYQRELDATAQELGYKDHAAWVEASKAAKAQSSQAAKPAEPATTQPAATEKPKTSSATDPESRLAALEQENQRLTQNNQSLLDEKKRINREAAKLRRETAALRDELTNSQTEAELKLAAQAAGVTDVEYGVAVYMRAIQGMNEEDLKGMDENKFFSDTMRKSHPHLYKAEERTVNTGTKSDTQITTPATGSGNKSQASDNGKVDAKTMTPQEFQTLLRKRGLTPPSTGGMPGGMLA